MLQERVLRLFELQGGIITKLTTRVQTREGRRIRCAGKRNVTPAIILHSNLCIYYPYSASLVNNGIQRRGDVSNDRARVRKRRCRILGQPALGGAYPPPRL